MPASSSAAFAAPTIRLSTDSLSSRPKGVWAQPMMQAVMELSPVGTSTLGNAFACNAFIGVADAVPQNIILVAIYARPLPSRGESGKSGIVFQPFQRLEKLDRLSL